MKVGNPYNQRVNRRQAKAVAISVARVDYARFAIISASAFLLGLLLLGAGRLIGP